MNRDQTQVLVLVNKNLTLDPKIQQALSRGGVIDMTTTGAKSGEARRLEIVFHNIDGKIYISGMPFPHKRSWLANLEKDPHFTFHLKGPVKADLPAEARVITDETERRTVMAPIAKFWKRKDLETMVEQSPLIEVSLD